MLTGTINRQNQLFGKLNIPTKTVYVYEIFTSDFEAKININDIISVQTVHYEESENQ